MKGTLRDAAPFAAGRVARTRSLGLAQVDAEQTRRRGEARDLH